MDLHIYASISTLQLCIFLLSNFTLKNDAIRVLLSGCLTRARLMVSDIYLKQIPALT